MRGGIRWSVTKATFAGSSGYETYLTIVKGTNMEKITLQWQVETEGNSFDIMVRIDREPDYVADFDHLAKFGCVSVLGPLLNIPHCTSAMTRLPVKGTIYAEVGAAEPNILISRSSECGFHVKILATEVWEEICYWLPDRAIRELFDKNPGIKLIPVRIWFEEGNCMSRLEAMRLLSRAWEAAKADPHNTKKLREVFQVISNIRHSGWEVYWNGFNEPYMP
jgi:hypothetical protein